MKICWDNLEKVFLSRNGNLRESRHIYIEKESCEECNNPFLMLKLQPTNFCSKSCSRVGEKHPLYKKGHSEKSKKKMRGKIPWNKDKHLSQKHRKNLSESTLREKHWNWKGGKSFEPYCEEFKCKEWREIIYERDKDKFCWNPQCEGKGSRECLHHIDYDKKNCHPSNIIKICNSCNTIANKDREWWESFYKEIIRRRLQ